MTTSDKQGFTDFDPAEIKPQTMDAEGIQVVVLAERGAPSKFATIAITAPANTVIQILPDDPSRRAFFAVSNEPDVYIGSAGVLTNGIGYPLSVKDTTTNGISERFQTSGQIFARFVAASGNATIYLFVEYAE